MITSTRSNTFGGGGGASFDDSHVIENWGPVRQIVVRHGDRVDAIGVLWANGNFVNHGGSGGNETIVNLAADEFISGVQGRSGDRLDQISFQSNKQSYGPFGGGGGAPFSVNFSGGALHYIFGRSGSGVDQIGFAFGAQPAALPSTIARTAEHGGMGGNPFDDLNAAGNIIGKVVAVRVRHGDRIDSINASYDGQSGSTAHGGGGGTEDTFSLDSNEWITEVHGRSGDGVDQLQFYTNLGRVSPVYGGNGGNPFVESRPNSIVKAFFGRSGAGLDQIGMYFEDAKPLSIEVTNIDYDIGGLSMVAQPPEAAMVVMLENKTSSPQQVTQSRSIAVTDTSTTTISESTEISVTMKFTTDFLFEKEEVTLGFKQSVSYSTGSSHSEQNTYTVQFAATVPPNSSIKGTCMVRKGVYDVPYTATAKVTYQDRPAPVIQTLHGILKGVATTSVDAEYSQAVAAQGA